MSVPLVVLIPTHGRESVIGDTLASLAVCNLPSNFWKTIVVENGPDAPAQGIVASAASEHPQLNIEYLHTVIANKSNALNEAISTLTQNCLLFLTDDDIRFDPNILEVYASASTDIETGMVWGGTVELETQGVLPQHLRGVMPTSMTGITERNRPRSFFLGANYGCFSEDIKRLGGFDIRFGPGSELQATGNESTMMRTMRDAGFEFRFLPEAIVWHLVDYTKITDAVIVTRRYRGGVERGIRLYLQYAGMQISNKKRLIPAKIKLSKLLGPVNSLWGKVGWPASSKAKALSQAAYHQGMVKGWSHTRGQHE